MAKFTFSAFGDEISSDLNKQLDAMTALGIRCLEIRGSTTRWWQIRRPRKFGPSKRFWIKRAVGFRLWAPQ